MAITINWEAFLLVFAAAIGFSTLIVVCFSLGIRMLTNAQGSSGKARKGNFKAQQVESLNMVGAYTMFALCLCALAYGIYLVVPFLPH